MTHLSIVPSGGSGDEAVTVPHDEARRHQQDQVYEANRLVGLAATSYLEWPWPLLSNVMGGIGPGSLGFVCAASGAGKTSFLLSAMRRWFSAGRRVYYAGLETRPHILRTQWACRELSIDAGDVLTGRAPRTIAEWPSVRERLRKEFMSQVTSTVMDRIRFAPFRFLNLRALETMYREAADFDADLVVVDHIDHVDGERGNQYESSVAAVKKVLALTQDYELRTIAASQTNLSGAGSDPLRFHRPVRRDHVKNGNHKLEVADWALGLYRPLKPGLTRGVLKDWREGKIDLAAILDRGVTELNVMKHRAYGNREGTRIRLGFAKGEVLDEPVSNLFGQARI